MIDIQAPIAMALEARHITKRFPSVVANDDVWIQLRHGEILGLLGENGAGKRTLVKMLFGLYDPDEGEILIRGESVQREPSRRHPPRRRNGPRALPARAGVHRGREHHVGAETPPERSTHGRGEADPRDVGSVRLMVDPTGSSRTCPSAPSSG